VDAGCAEGRVAEQALEDADVPAGAGHEDGPELSAAPLEGVVVRADDRHRCRVGDDRRSHRSDGGSDRHTQNQGATEPAVATSTRILHLVPLLLGGLSRTTRLDATTLGWSPATQSVMTY
jgi:hypothetical protein